MAKDLIYYYDKDYKRHILGEVQTNFNQSFVMDGTKDSYKCEVINYEKLEFMPYTIVWHESTNTWWIVSHDKVERYANESETYIYRHTLTLLGAIELLNAKELTDCGFNANKYTIIDVLSRLIKLSSFEFKGYTSGWDITVRSFAYIDLNQNVDYIKSFENYTLLSALREFFDGYNLAIKLVFYQAQDGDDYYIRQALFDFVPKTGLNNVTPISESEFEDVREIKTIDKNSYGTSVVSNAENVTSTVTKTYPELGSVRLTSDAWNITRTNAMLRLPSPVAKLNWLKVDYRIGITCVKTSTQGGGTYTYFFYGGDENRSINEAQYEIMCQSLCGIKGNVDYDYELYVNLQAKKEIILEFVEKAGSMKLYTGWEYNSLVNGFKSPDGQPIFSGYVNHYAPGQVSTDYTGALLVGSKQDRECFRYPAFCVEWERGRNTLTNFSWLESPEESTGQRNRTTLYSYEYTELKTSLYDSGRAIATISLQSQNDSRTWTFSLFQPDNVELSVLYTFFSVNYEPMNDLKLKVDNKHDSKLFQLYNQTGKLVDGNGLSKQLLSYSKTIESDTITKYQVYYKESDIPPLGQIVLINNVPYVIGNISKTYYQNESNDSGLAYYIDCEFTLSKQVAVKSLLVNPNTAIRDYGIPQQYNVKRKQIYKDFYEVNLADDPNANTDYKVPFDKMVNLSYSFQGKDDHIAVMEIKWHESGYMGALLVSAINLIVASLIIDGAVYQCADSGTITTGDSNLQVDKGDKIVWNKEDNQFSIYHDYMGDTVLQQWYYQLDTTAYNLKKSYYEVVDFKDNNIIGYSTQNVVSRFDITRILSGLYDAYNSPVSYVKSDGTCESINICMVESSKLYNLYEQFTQSLSITSGVRYGNVLANYSCFIDRSIYYGGFLNYSIDKQGIRFYQEYTPTSRVFNIALKTIGALPQDYDGTVDRLKAVITSTNIPRNKISIFQLSKVGDEYYLVIQLDASITTYDLFQIYFYMEIYNLFPNVGAIDICDFQIEEPNYDKDAIEVPVFEYCCQIVDTENVLVGENIMSNYETDELYLYSYAFVQKNIANDTNSGNLFPVAVNQPRMVSRTEDNVESFYCYVPDGAYMKYVGNKIYIHLKDFLEVNLDTKEQSGTWNNRTFDKTKDLIIYRYKITNSNKLDNTVKYDPDLMFIVRNLDQATFINDTEESGSPETLVLSINHYNVD